MIKLYTIGFTEKSAEQFFNLLKNNGVKKILDIRISNISQLAGFAKGSDLKYFAKEIGNIDYEHNIDLAPTKEMMTSYRNKEFTWKEYEVKYLNLIKSRKIADKIDFPKLHKFCLLCSEHTPDRCHRRLLAEYLQKINRDIEIIHLM
jgi:uncharacterized protein (DUF488 family)